MKEYKVIVNNCSTIRWYKPGTNILHREDGPAVEYSNGTKYWYKDGKHHREDGPAIEYSNGDISYYLNGICFYYKEDYEKELAKRNNSCANKVIEIEGKKYKLVEV